MSGGIALGRWRTPLIAAVLIVGALLRAAAVHHHHAVDLDEGRYLDNALNLVEGRGFTTHFTSHFFRPEAAYGPGRPPLHAEDMSAPLYPLLLAATFLLTGPSLGAAQAWSLLAGCLTILLTFQLARRLFDEAAGLLAALLVAVHPDMVLQSSWAMTETLFTAGLLGVLRLAAREPPRERLVRHAAALGLACAALYLLRANGAAVAAGVGIAMLASHARRGAPSAALAFAAGLLVAAAPWLARNQTVFGSPTHSALAHVAWTETGRDLFTRGIEPPTIASFRREHGDAGLARNVAHRVWRSASGLLAGDRAAFALLGLVYPLAALATIRSARALPGHLTVVLSAMLLLAVPTHTRALGRYMLPLRPWIYLCVVGAALHAVSSLPRLRARWGTRARPLAAAVVATGVALVGWSAPGAIRESLAADESARDADAREAARWIAANTPPDAVLMEGGWLHQYAFLFDRCVVWIPAGDLEDLRRTAATYGAGYLVVSERVLRYRPRLRPRFGVDPDGALLSADLPEGYEEVFAGAGRRIVVWRIPPGASGRRRMRDPMLDVRPGIGGELAFTGSRSSARIESAPRRALRRSR